MAGCSFTDITPPTKYMISQIVLNRSISKDDTIIQTYNLTGFGKMPNTKTNFHVEGIQIIWCSYPIHLRWLDHSVVYLHVSLLFKSPLLLYYRFQCEPPGYSPPLRQHSDGSLQWDRYSLRHAVPRSDGTFDQKGGKCLWQLMAPNVTSRNAHYICTWILIG